MHSKRMTPMSGFGLLESRSCCQRMQFGVNLHGRKKYFILDAYAFGAFEEADVCVVVLLGRVPAFHALGMRILANIHCNGDKDTSFANNIQGAIIMHAACFVKQDIVDAMSSGIIPTALMC